MGNCPTCSIEQANINLDPLCNGKRMWTTFFFSSFAIFLIGCLAIFVYDLFNMLINKCRSMQLSSRNANVRIQNQNLANVVDDGQLDYGWVQDIKEWENSLIFGRTKLGKIFVTIILFCNFASLILYCCDAKYKKHVESCTRFYKSRSMQIELGLNCVFFIFFILRFAAAKKKRRFWISLHSLVDIFTIPPSFLAFYFDRSWIGFRCLRVLPLMNIPDILQYMSIIERPRTIRLIQLASQFISIWFAAAGIVHLVENSGDFFCDYCNIQEMDIFNSVYFMIITMTTVGYGDFSCKTYIGKTVVLISLISGLAVFATMIPEFSNLFGSKGPYYGRYDRVKGKRHVIICGHITSNSLAPFLRDFLHQGRDQVDEIDVLIIDRKTPDIEMEALLKRYYMKVQYFVGSIMDINDLKRLKADKATACLIIANKECADPNSDDSANIMRVISLKSFNSRIRIILQIIRYHHKLNVASIPGWNTGNDEMICISELKLGLIGMSCVVPGFATMMTNIFRMSSYNVAATDTTTQIWPWRKLYHRGAGMKMFLVELPPSFYGKSFADAALICFKLRVMLLAIESDKTDENATMKIVVDVVPCDKSVIGQGSRAFIVCMSSDYTNRVKYYCSICYPVLDNLTESDLKSIHVCSHMKSNKTSTNEVQIQENLSNDTNVNEHVTVQVSDSDNNQPLLSSQSDQPYTPCCDTHKMFTEDDLSCFDSTGMLYFTKPRNLEDAVLDINLLRKHYGKLNQNQNVNTDRTSSKFPLTFKNHIIVCIHADQSTPKMGLRNFVMPLRASSFRRHELPLIIFVTDLSYIRTEWEMLSTFPDIYILNGSPINPYNLKLISIDQCRQCVIMSTLDRGNLDTYLVDKSSVLCALTIRKMQMKSAGLLFNQNATRKSKSWQDVVDTVNLIYQNRVNTLTSLTVDSNVQYVEQGYIDEADLQFFLTTPFASGATFADSVLDCILSCAYYNDNSVTLLRNILSGGIDPQLEEILAEDERLVQCEKREVLNKRNRARAAMIPIYELIVDIQTRSEPVTFSTLFCESLQHHRMLVMGIYRLLDVLLKNDPHPNVNQPFDDRKRIVIYYPPHNYHMDSSDMVYVMQHSHSKTS